MIKHYLKIAFRNLLKYKMQSVISIIGIAVGFTCFALSVLWIRYEMTYDNFHEGADRIYLAGNKFELQGDGFSYYSSSLLLDYLVKNYPEVETACHLFDKEQTTVVYEKNSYEMWKLAVDTSFISMFNITVLEGSNELRMEGNQIAITDKASERIFGGESPIGKQLAFPDDVEKTIVAVVKSWKGHSMYPFDILSPYNAREPHWGMMQCHTLLRVHPNTDVEALAKKLEKYKVTQDSYEMDASTPLALLSGLRSTHPREDVNVKLNHVRLFAFIGGLVIVCGLCNYLTMLVTRIRMRKRELALRKVNGSSNGGLLALVLTEFVLLLMIALGIGVMLIELVLPMFKRLSQIDESTSFFYTEVLIYMVVLIVVTVGFASLLISYISRRTLLGSISQKSNLHLSGWFYKASVLFQLFISLGFVFCTLVMMKQLNFLLNTRELGIERHNVGVVLRCTAKDVPFKKIFSQMPEVEASLQGFYTPIPKMIYSSTRLTDWEDKSEDAPEMRLEDETINQEYADFFGVELLEGSMLDEKDEEGIVLLNETAVKAFGWKEPIGKKFFWKKNCAYTVKGVIKDIYYNAPIHPVAPAMFSLPQTTERGHPIFKVKEGMWKVVAEKLKAEVAKIDPNAELDLSNMEEVYDAYMKSEQTLSKLLGVVSGICILIAVFGIFSLVTLSCQQRRKEIAIRKVNGANTSVILRLFFKEYSLLLVLSSCIAFPLGYVIMKHWLENYVKQTPIEWWLYGVIFIGMGLVIFLSIIWRVWIAARQNPAEVIKNE